MPENKVKKYFSLIEAWAWCDICEEHISINIDKKEIIDGLKMSIYTKELKHSNPYPDTEDPEDISGNEHTIYVYINDSYDITGVKSFFGESPSIEEIAAKAAQEGGEVRIPVVVKDIPPMAVQLGMLNKEQFKVLKICDGMNSLEQCAEIAQMSVDEMEKMMEQLRKKGLVKVIRRT
jgi:DNA-binding CsgD family transcriptional regulator